MSENTENLEAPNWLSELEKKREIRLKARLGHEAGAGAPCIKCNDKCPGLDLHFWRKICKNCKCSKEDHDVHDDDIYGWAQFQLLGSKPNRIKKKIVLPGKKDEVELDWAPKGNTETIDKYLKTLAPESLPVKGSQAAQERKQLLQKQIPIHDIDPTLCHELTDSELAKMQDYIKHMKNSAGVGQVIQFSVNYANVHLLGDLNVKVVADRYPKGVPSIETVQLLGERKAGTLTKQFDKLGIQDQKELDAFFDKIPKPHNMTAHTEKLGYGNVATTPDKIPKSIYTPENRDFTLELTRRLTNVPPPPLVNIQGQDVPRYPPNYSQSIEVNKNLASRFAREHILSDPNLGAVPNFANEATTEPQFGYASAEAVPIYPTENTELYRAGPDYANEINRNAVDLPHYAPGTLNIQSEQQNPTSVRNIRDLAYGTHDLANSNYSKPLQSYNPSQLSVSESQLVPNPVNIGPIRDISYEYSAPEIKQAIQGENALFEGLERGRQVPEDVALETKQCRKCSKFFEPGEFAIFVEKSNALYHSECFKCAGCNQSLADLFYFYDKESDNIYCGRDFAKIRGIPRCKACDELIFVKEYCLAENSTFHLKHFCCFECDQALAGQNYVVEDSQPVCLPCFEKLKANKCISCSRVIRPDEQGVSLAEGTHFHAADECFCCSVCRKVLHGARLLFRNNKLYCSHDCLRSDQ
ncbi:hypothetical protein Zmor_012295 [Zophobas morio]|uniref:Testin n=1 Tax=Zophobas morio TaxID=2755281 RepID=A0AA38HH12_9CUCU|nr:hypothetical protein Zmor_012295 [Zophobas morio]